MPAYSNNASIKLYNVEGFARKSGEEKNGGTWTQAFYGEIEDSAIELYYSDGDAPDLSRMSDAQCRRKLAPCFPTCCVCHRYIAGDAWLCLDGGDYACDSHVKLMSDKE